MGMVKFRLQDSSCPIYFIINGYNAVNEYIVCEVNESSITIDAAVIDGVFQAEIKKIYLSNI
ncbi:hypothetical protein [Fusobacterium ulcerans]|uniref:hypothetical protein n=1 Tax=Fusobacterium ulcerans TaxID=861 RepID=UPI0030B07AE1